MSKKENFKVLSEIEHVLTRPNMYIGSVSKETFEDYIFEENKFIKKEIQYVPGLVKIINEIIDNCIDEAIRTNFEFANRVKVNFTEDSIVVEDNGRGISVIKDEKSGKYLPELAWTQARAGTNFSDEDRITLGLNGLGSVASNIFSSIFTGETSDGENKCVVKCTNNLSEVNVKVKKCEKKFTKVTFSPDLKRFKVSEKDFYGKNSIYQVLIYQRIFSLSICYPKITFIFNGKEVKTSNLKQVLKYFGETFEIIQNDNYLIGIFSNPEDEFKFFSYINGLRMLNGGTHVDIITNDIISKLRENLIKKYKTIKPGEIKSKLFIVFYGWNFNNAKFDSQTKERLTNSTAEIRKFLGPVDFEAVVKRILKNKALIEPIVEIYKIKEEFEQRKLINKENSGKPKKVVSKKYVPASNETFGLCLAEGASASSSIAKALGREKYGFFELRGLPISAEKTTLLNFLKNAEMKLLTQILDVDITKPLTFKEDSENWYQFELDNGESIIANENDMVLIDKKWVAVEKLINKNLIK